MLLSSIAEIVMREMNNTRGFELLKDGLANEYTGNNERLFSETGGFQFTALTAGLKEEIGAVYG
jgi:hypothetical protein